MDTSDSAITFNAEGQCNLCTQALSWGEKNWLPNEHGAALLEAKLAEIRKAGQGKEFDCLIGLSGGTDSSYLAYKAKEWGLRPLIFHVDGGWDTPESIHNVQAVSRYLNAQLQTYTVNWEEMRDLQLAFLKAGVPNQDIPQDHLFFAVLYNYARTNNIRYWFSGSNFASECILPGSWGYNAMDIRHLQDIHNKFGQVPLTSYATLSFLRYCQYYLGLGVSSVEMVAPLNWLPYQVEAARAELAQHCGWKDYGGKHCESYFTRYFQCAYLPERFGFDKRKAHLSSLIISGQITREQALAKLAEPFYDEADKANDQAIICQRLGLSLQEWQELLSLPVKRHEDYVTSTHLVSMAMKLKTVQNAFSLLAKGDVGTFFSKLLRRVTKG